MNEEICYAPERYKNDSCVKQVADLTNLMHAENAFIEEQQRELDEGDSRDN